MKPDELAIVEAFCRGMAKEATDSVNPHDDKCAVELLRKFAGSKLRRQFVFDSTLADDVVSEILVGLTTGAATRHYDPQRGPFGAFLLGAVKNLCWKAAQQIARERQILEHLEAEREPNRYTDDALEWEELSAMIDFALGELPPHYELALRQFYKIGVSDAKDCHHDLEQAMNTSSLRRRALKRLRFILETTMPATEWMSLLR